MPACLQYPRQRSILVVDDDPGISRLLRYNLEDRDTEVISAASGYEGIKLLVEKQVELLFLDVRLPDFNGWGILSLLRMSEVYRQLPVIMISVEPPGADLMAWCRPDGYIQKPFDVRDLLLAVEKAVAPEGDRRKLVNKAACRG